MMTIDALIDTSILIDLWRNNPSTQAWLKTLPSGTLIGIPVLVAMEFMDGTRNNTERQRAVKLMQPYPVIYLEPGDSQWAQMQHAAYKLSHNVGIIDALIASAGARLGVPIYTLNAKHFTPLPGVSAIRPY